MDKLYNKRNNAVYIIFGINDSVSENSFKVIVGVANSYMHTLLFHQSQSAREALNQELQEKAHEEKVARLERRREDVEEQLSEMRIQLTQEKIRHDEELQEAKQRIRTEEVC